MLNPAKKRCAIDRNAALAHHLFEIAAADPVFAIPAGIDPNESVAKRRPLKSDMVEKSAKDRQFDRLPPTNATEFISLFHVTFFIYMNFHGVAFIIKIVSITHKKSITFPRLGLKITCKTTSNALIDIR